jgi:hypothetical protein
MFTLFFVQEVFQIYNFFLLLNKMSQSGVFLGAVDIRDFPADSLNVNVAAVDGNAPDFATETTLALIETKTALLSFNGDDALKVVDPISTEFLFYDGDSTASASASLILSVPAKLLTFQGNCSVGITITIQFYSELKSTWYSSQYQYVVPAGGADFGFAIPACPMGVKLVLSNPETTGTITASVAYA